MRQKHSRGPGPARVKYSTRFIRPKDGAQRLADVQIYFWVHKNKKRLIKKWDFSTRKFKNIENPKMVSKLLKGHYLRSYEQFKKKSDFKYDFELKRERKNRTYVCIFEYLHKNKKKLIKTNFSRGNDHESSVILRWLFFDKKYDFSLWKFKKSEPPKMVLKRLKSHYLRSYEHF